jgi:hypothetical protein
MAVDAAGQHEKTIASITSSASVSSAANAAIRPSLMPISLTKVSLAVTTVPLRMTVSKRIVSSFVQVAG